MILDDAMMHFHHVWLPYEMKMLLQVHAVILSFYPAYSWYFQRCVVMLELREIWMPFSCQVYCQYFYITSINNHRKGPLFA